MAQTTQIVPKFSFPYVETVINDYTQVTDDTTDAVDSSVKFLFPFTSSKGIDNIFVQKSSYDSFVSTYGVSNYKKYGQPLMMPLSILKTTNTKIWCMRVMPTNAAYSNNVVSLYFRADASKDVATASERKFRLKLTQKHFDSMTTTDALTSKLDVYDGETVEKNGKKVYIDSEGYQQEPMAILRSSGRGTYGDSYRIRLSQNTQYEKEYGIKMYNYEILTTEGGLSKVATYVGGCATSDKYTTATLINDILEDTAVGEAPVDIYLDEDNIETVYNAYIAFCKQQNIDLAAEYETKKTTYAIPAGMLEGTTTITSEFVSKVAELKSIKAMITATNSDNLIDLDAFDPIFGLQVASTESLPFIYFPETLTSDVNTEASGYLALNYTTNTNLVSFGDTQGASLYSGSNGYFDSPRTETVDEVVKQWTYDDEVSACYTSAFDGTFDKKILSHRRTPVTAFFDANYPYAVKQTMASLIALRNDALLYLDTGIIESYSSSNLTSLIDDYSVFDSYMVSKNLQHYTIKEPSTQKRVVVTITYFLASNYASHISNYGTHIPYVKSYAQLTGHIKNSLTPSIEDYETDLKEKLYENRFNYFETLDDNIYQRGVQNTSQSTETDLLEESNVTVLFEMKRIVENEIQARLYDFADADTRKSFKTYIAALFADWVGTKVYSFDVDFKANEWEAERSILHAYLSVVFRGLQKRAIVEIDINKRTYTSDTTTDETTTEEE